MPVPKAAMNEQGGLPARKDQIRRPRKLSDVQTKTEAESVRRASHDQFGLRAFAANAAHYLGPTSRVDDICHYIMSLVTPPIGISQLLGKVADNRRRRRSIALEVHASSTVQDRTSCDRCSGFLNNASDGAFAKKLHTSCLNPTLFMLLQWRTRPFCGALLSRADGSFWVRPTGTGFKPVQYIDLTIQNELVILNQSN
jgi:hypothetical protein